MKSGWKFGIRSAITGALVSIYRALIGRPPRSRWVTADPPRSRLDHGWGGRIKSGTLELCLDFKWNGGWIASNISFTAAAAKTVMAVTTGSRLMGWKVKVSTEEGSGRSQDEVALRMSVTDRHHWLDSTRKTGGGSRYAPANYLMEKKN
ncbi:hypothetical protein RRG08_036754 [Elysia crispata]|uniref:Uncharacterized protein n=1 Tax=Elysia crispata TaxID=231223 RepID=A0AAE0ZGP2_9GAST|nr:hypothetical protein RRG08_036754 [Elysia crispata]